MIRNLRKNNKGITIITLVVTIIILIILAGISVNMLLGEEGIITRAQQAKENTILAQEEEAKQLNTLYSQLDGIEGSTGSIGDLESEAIQKLTEFKSRVATAITNEGVNTLETMVRNIGKILQVGTDGTATEEDILEGKTAWVHGNKIVGTMKSNSVKYIKSESFSDLGSSFSIESNKKYIVFIAGYVDDCEGTDFTITNVQLSGCTILTESDLKFSKPRTTMNGSYIHGIYSKTFYIEATSDLINITISRTHGNSNYLTFTHYNIFEI